METDPGTGDVTHMDRHEIAIFLRYREQLAAGGRTRDELPYTPEFDNLRGAYNQDADEPLDHRGLWRHLRKVLKCGEVRIEAYLRSSDIQVPPTPQ